MQRKAWFNFLTGQQSNGATFPFQFNGYTHLRFEPDSSMWLSGTMNTFAVLMPNVLQLAELSPAVSFVGSAASGTSPFTAGQLISVYGSQLGPTTGVSGQVNVDLALSLSAGGTKVLFDGIAAPILYSRADIVNTAIPCEFAGHTSTQMVVEYLGAGSSPITIPLGPAAPAIFTVDSSGKGQGLVFNSDFSQNSAANPAARGSAVFFYATGLGAMSPACVDGLVYTSNFPSPILQVVAGVGNVGAHVLYAGQAPYLMAGVAQINIAIPTDVSPGVLPLTLVVNGTFSPQA
jgi:uncharacterized protein (TIGR03437 family)